MPVGTNAPRKTAASDKAPRTFPPAEPHPSQAVGHLLWRVETALGGLLTAAAMGREAKAAKAMLAAGYDEETILRLFLDQQARKPTAYSLHFLQTDITALAGRCGAYSAEIASALSSLADEDGWEPEPPAPLLDSRPAHGHLPDPGNAPHERSRE